MFRCLHLPPYAFLPFLLCYSFRCYLLLLSLIFLSYSFCNSLFHSYSHTLPPPSSFFPLSHSPISLTHLILSFLLILSHFPPSLLLLLIPLSLPLSLSALPHFLSLSHSSLSLPPSHTSSPTQSLSFLFHSLPPSLPPFLPPSCLHSPSLAWSYESSVRRCPPESSDEKHANQSQFPQTNVRPRHLAGTAQYSELQYVT